MKDSALLNIYFNLKWYYDDELVMCLSFVYKGCGGNENRFNSELECLGACRPGKKWFKDFLF